MTARITKRTRLAQRRRKRRFIYLLLALGFLVLAYAGLGWGLTHKNVAITTIAISGNDVVKTEQLKSTVRQGLAVTRALLLYGGTVLTYDESGIKSDLLYTYPRLESVDIRIAKLDTLELVVAEREAVAQWCTGISPVNVAIDNDEEGSIIEPVITELELPSCYLVDRDGFVFEKIDGDVPQDDLVVYDGDLGGDVLRQSLLHGGFAEVHGFITGLRELSIEPLSVKLAGLEAEIVSEGHPLLKVLLDEKLKRTHSYVEVTLTSQEYKELSESEEGAEYIDVRFGNRVYYK